MTMPSRERWQHLTPLLDEFLDLDPADRLSRLAELRAHRPATADDIDALLEASAAADASGFLAGQAPEAPPASPTLAGTPMGPYVIEEPLGQGGSGSVWRARRADGRFEGHAAIKLLHQSLIGRAAAQRFQHEGGLLARLSHPNIAKLLDAGVSATGQPYLILELVEGERIDAYCDRLALSIDQRLALFEEVLAAVAHAHSHLIIHRDIKPTNIMVGADGHVKLLDFGISKLIEDQSPETTITATGQRAMTPEFAAPEQILGQTVTTATDVYSLGILLYQLLTGRHPTTRRGAACADAARAALDTEPPRLSAALSTPPGGKEVEGAVAAAMSSLSAIAAARGTGEAKLRRELAGDLEKIVAHALRKRPADRYPTVAALSDDLRRYRSNQPVLVQEDALLYRWSKFLRRHRVGVAAVAAVAVATGAGLTGTILQAQRAQEQAVAARAQAARADAQAQLAQQQREAALQALSRAKAADEFMRFMLSRSAGKPIPMSELLQMANTSIEQQFRTEPGLRAYLQFMVAQLYGEIEDYDHAAPVLVQAQESARLAGDPALLAQVDCISAGLDAAIGHGEEAGRRIDDALHRLERLHDPSSDGLIDCLQQRSVYARNRGQAQAAMDDSIAAMALMGPPRPGQRVTQAILMEGMAMGHMMLGDPGTAITDFDATLETLDSIGRSDTSLTLNTRNNFGVVLTRAGLWRRADAVFRKALADAPADDPVTSQVLLPNHARLLVSLGQSEQAQPIAERALQTARRGENRRARGYTALAAAWIACDLGQLRACEARLGMAHEDFTRMQPRDDTGLGTLALLKADLSMHRNNYAAAREHLAQAIGLFDGVTSWSPMPTRTLTMLARADMGAKDTVAALRHANEAVARGRQFARTLPASGWLGEALLAQALALQANGDLQKRDAAAREALAQLREAGNEAAASTREAAALVALAR